MSFSKYRNTDWQIIILISFVNRFDFHVLRGFEFWCPVYQSSSHQEWSYQYRVVFKHCPDNDKKASLRVVMRWNNGDINGCGISMHRTQ